MKKVVIGILAHVDAGKTTLSEALLYMSGKIRKLGRVDKMDAYLDTYELEKERGITIFSKQAIVDIGAIQMTLLDTPGHVDFSAEMERTMRVLDYAILVISGADGIQGHTKTLWMLLKMYKVPVFIFINKMDQVGTDKKSLINELKDQLSDGCIEFGQDKTEVFNEEIAVCDERIMESFIDTGQIEENDIKKLVKERKVFPCFFGSALKLDGVENMMQGMSDYIIPPTYSDDFGAKVFKITRDENGNRLTHIKITGGKLNVKDILKSDDWEEKVNQIRIYSGEKFEVVSECEAGSVCAVTGLSMAMPGEGFGIEKSSYEPVLEPVLSYRMILPEGCDYRVMIKKLREIEEEEPELRIVWDEKLQEIQVRIMGEIQLEILQSMIQSRFGVFVEFDDGGIIYKETIASIVEGVGHFEPLRHYAEVHLLLEPGEPGSGLVFGNKCSEDILSGNFQRLVLQHLEEKVHKGVLTGSGITDMRITLVSGKAHNKHTEGGDFREATWRAVRQGLMEAKSVLLEPYYSFSLEIPENMVGRAMTDISQMGGACEIAETDCDRVVVEGSAPVRNMRNYQKEVMAYTKGYGRLFYNMKGYEPCHNSDQIIEEIGYDPTSDIGNTSSSVFCTQGSGFIVEWDEVKNYMHLESVLKEKSNKTQESYRHQSKSTGDHFISDEEVNKIFQKTFYSNQGKDTKWKKQNTVRNHYKSYNKVNTSSKHVAKKDYLLVDGYNIIYAWPELDELVEHNMEAARMKLLDILSNYQGMRKYKIIVVFDAYRVQGNREEIITYNNIHLVYTKEAQTADQYIEKFASDHNEKYNITVATSDGLEQLIVRGRGCRLLSARELKGDIERVNERVRQELQKNNRNSMSKSISTTSKEKLYEFINEQEKND
ncbi:translation factor GTPase family protein [Haloplasma contractile]|nr:TetM/TetW/TetO/TetS family tetracycline resistance ribosomal protection protein [Haloplasma contractile]